MVVSNNVQNKFDAKIVVVAMTTEKVDNIQLFEVFVEDFLSLGLDEPSKVLCNYPHTIDKELRLVKCLGIVGSEIIQKVRKALKLTLNLNY